MEISEIAPETVQIFGQLDQIMVASRYLRHVTGFKACSYRRPQSMDAAAPASTWFAALVLNHSPELRLREERRQGRGIVIVPCLLKFFSKREKLLV